VETNVTSRCARKPTRVSVRGKINSVCDGVIKYSYFITFFNIFLSFVIGTKVVVVVVVLLVAALLYEL
jgi:hypothetical protein